MEAYTRIELFGFPGSGKTTSLQQIASSHSGFCLKQANVPFTVKNSLSVLFYLLKHPNSFVLFGWLKYVSFSSYKSYLNTIIRFILRIKSLENNINTGEKCIVDEGLLQITWSLLLLPAISNDKFDIEKKLDYLKKKWWLKTDLLVYHLEVSDEEYVRRVQTRERVHFFSKHFINKDEKVIRIGKLIADLILQRAEDYYEIRNV